MEFPELKVALITAANTWKPNAILIEDKASGQALIQELKHKTTLAVIPIIPSKDKFLRLLSIASVFECGKVILPESATWLSSYEHELTNFPNTDHDDIVDSTTQFLEWMHKKEVNIGRIRCF